MQRGLITVSEHSVKLATFKSTDLELLASWLQQPHVQPWYPEPSEDLGNAKSLCSSVQESDAVSGHFLILVNTKPVGYLRWQLVPKAVLDEIGLTDIPDNSADVDLLIGERSEICRGVGAGVLAAIEEKLSARGDVPLVGLTTDKKNHYAHRAFEKSGYSIAAEYSPDGYGDCYVYTKQLS